MNTASFVAMHRPCLEDEAAPMKQPDLRLLDAIRIGRIEKSAQPLLAITPPYPVPRSYYGNSCGRQMLAQLASCPAACAHTQCPLSNIATAAHSAMLDQAPKAAGRNDNNTRLPAKCFDWMPSACVTCTCKLYDQERAAAIFLIKSGLQCPSRLALAPILCRSGL
eukprot:scaffold89021_cov17-Tisochrysis_lutea.AAC.1